MTTFHFPPKEFGDRSDVGLSKLRQLENIDVPFLKSNPDGDTVVMKGNGFNTVTKRRPQTDTLGRYVLQGRFAGDVNGTLVMSTGLHAAFRTKPLTLLSGGRTGLFELGVKRTVLVTDLTSSGQITIARSRDFVSRITELTTFAQPTNNGVTFWVFFNHAAYFRASGAPLSTAVQYETATYSKLTAANNVAPTVVYSNDGIWTFSATVGYDGYDHYSFSGFQLMPNVFLICHAVVPRGSLHPLGSRTNSPAGIVPYPLFQISTDCARTFTPVNLDAMFVGSTYQYTYPLKPNGPGATPGLGGYFAVTGIQVLSLATVTFLSVEVIVDSPSSSSFARNGYNFEMRIFRVAGLNFTVLAAVNIPNGYGTLWSSALVPVFAAAVPNTPPKVFGQPGRGFGAIGYMALSDVPTNPNMIFVSFDNGTTWEPPRNLPGNAYWCVAVGQSSSRELTCAVYEQTTPPQVVRYASMDYGLTWQRRQIIATNVTPLTSTQFLHDFNLLLPIDQDDGSLPTVTPMNGWRFDSRIPLFAVRAPP